MKSKIIFLCSLAFSIILKAQTFVSTEPSNRNVILEEYTGVGCTWCPDGHRIANELMKASPGRFFPINIHQGGFANTIPDYRTEFGDALANQIGLTGYPMGTVSRHVFYGSTTGLERGEWADASAQLMAQSSYVNVAAKSVIDVAARLLTVNVEIYYTANAPVEVNNLNVALLQNNILGRQVGMNLNPDQIIDGKYNHQHMLRHLITGQWGDEITGSPAAGTFVTKTYSYVVPPNLKFIDFELQNLDIIVFIAEGRQEIITGAKSEMLFVNTTPHLKDFKEIETFSCTPEILFSATVFNFTSENVTKLQFDYKINDGTANQITWEYKSIASLITDTVHFSFIPDVSDETYKITATLTGYNEKEIVDGIPFETTVNKKNIVTAEGEKFIFNLVTDRYANQTSFAFFDSNGNVVLKDGPFTNLTTNNTTVRPYTFEPPTYGCYKLEVYDKGENGINSGNGEGYVQFTDIEKNEIFYNDGKFGAQLNCYINVKESSFINKNIYKDEINLYQIGNILYIDENSDKITVNVVNLQGQSIINTDKKEINISRLTSGIYLIKINSEKEVAVRKMMRK